MPFGPTVHRQGAAVTAQHHHSFVLRCICAPSPRVRVREQLETATVAIELCGRVAYPSAQFYPFGASRRSLPALSVSVSYSVSNCNRRKQCKLPPTQTIKPNISIWVFFLLFSQSIKNLVGTSDIFLDICQTYIEILWYFRNNTETYF